MKKALSTAAGLALAIGILATPTAAQAVNYYGTYSELSSSACQASLKAFKDNGYSVTSCKMINNGTGIWYFQYGH